MAAIAGQGTGCDNQYDEHEARQWTTPTERGGIPLQATWEFIRENQDQFNDLLISHIRISATALLIAVLLYVPLGVMLARIGPVRLSGRRGDRIAPGHSIAGARVPVRAVAGVRLSPCPAGAGAAGGPADRAEHACRAAAGSIPPSIEAARGLGMSRAGVPQVELPLAFPVMHRRVAFGFGRNPGQRHPGFADRGEDARPVHLHRNLLARYHLPAGGWASHHRTRAADGGGIRRRRTVDNTRNRVESPASASRVAAAAEVKERVLRWFHVAH